MKILFTFVAKNALHVYQNNRLKTLAMFKNINYQNDMNGQNYATIKNRINNLLSSIPSDKIIMITALSLMSIFFFSVAIFCWIV